MKIKRFFAQDVRQAIRMVRDELGSDAVILSNRNIDGGVEIVAARDFDEQLIVRGNVDPVTKAESDDERARSQSTSGQAQGRQTRSPDAPVEKSKATPVINGQARSPMGRERTAGTNAKAASVSPRRENGSGIKAKAQPNVGQLSDRKPDTLADGAFRKPHDTPREVVRKLGSGSSRQQNQQGDAPLAASGGRNGGQPIGHPRKDRRLFNQRQNGVSRDDVTLDAISPASGEAPLLQEMFREIKRMREMLDGHSQPSDFGRGMDEETTCLDLIHILSDMGFSETIATEAVRRLGDGDDDPEGLLGQALNIIASEVSIADESLFAEGGVIALIGPTGVGKTTTIAKLAADFIIRHGRDSLALVTIDNYRIGAHEQLKTYGRLLDVPVRTASNADDLERILQNFRNKRLVLIDTPGMGQRDARLTDHLSMLHDDRFMVQSCLVISAVTQTRPLQEMLRAFGAFHPFACILTKLDEAVTFGVPVSALIEHSLPLAYACDGQRVPEDLHRVDAGSLLGLCLGEDTRSEGPVNTYSAPRRMSQSYA